MPVSLRCIVIVWAFAAAAAGAATTETRVVQLSSRDRGLIGTAACAGFGAAVAERIDATASRGSASVDATVQCQSHRREASLPVSHHSTCHNRAGKWTCEKGYDALQVTIRAGTVVAVVPRGIEPAAAVDAVTRASKMTVPPFRDPALPLFKGTCTVSVVPSPDYKGLTRFAIECTGGKLELNRLCWKEGCRHFIVSGDRV